MLSRDVTYMLLFANMVSSLVVYVFELNNSFLLAEGTDDKIKVLTGQT